MGLAFKAQQSPSLVKCGLIRALGSDSSDSCPSYPVGAGKGAVRGDSDVERELSSCSRAQYCHFPQGSFRLVCGVFFSPSRSLCLDLLF